MKSKLFFAALTLAAVASAPTAFARTSINVSFNAPPPPAVEFRTRPRWVMVPGTQVYRINDYDAGYDMFRYGGYVYVYNDGYWYRSTSYRGPFVAVREQYVPAEIFNVPQDSWHNYPQTRTRNDNGMHRGWRHRRWHRHYDNNDNNWNH